MLLDGWMETNGCCCHLKTESKWLRAPYGALLTFGLNFSVVILQVVVANVFRHGVEVVIRRKNES